jgi:Ankyrin repeats (3 copies)
MPVLPLPPDPDLEHLKHQAKDLLREQRADSLEACQRIREFHPRFRTASDAEIAAAPFALSDAQLTIARERGFPSWLRLRSHVLGEDRDDLSLPKHERIRDPLFRRAVDLLDAGDEDALRSLLREHPGLVHERVTLDGSNYFTHPSLLEFVAENPTRHGRLPQNIAAIAKIVLDAGGASDHESTNSTLALAASSAIAQECGVQKALIDVLCDNGADPNTASLAALYHGMFDSVHELMRRGAKDTVAAAAATGRADDARALLTEADAETRQRALALAAQFGHLEIARALLDAGEDPNRYSPPGGHSHATPLHQAALAGHDAIARLLVDRGARLDIEDLHHHATPGGWAAYAGHTALAEALGYKAS